MVFRCDSGPSRPDPPPPPTTTVTIPPPTTTVLPPPPPPPPAVGDCDIVGMNQSGIKYELHERTLRLFVPMDPRDGEPYVNVWTPDLHGVLLERCPANEWCSVELPGVGAWPIRLAAETRTDAGRVYQCDRIKFEVEVKPPPPPPTTTVPPTTTIPVCEYEPTCEVEVVPKGTLWATVYIRACDYQGVVTFLGTERNINGTHPRTKKKTLEIDLGCECEDYRMMMDTLWPATFSSVCAP